MVIGSAVGWWIWVSSTSHTSLWRVLLCDGLKILAREYCEYWLDSEYVWTETNHAQWTCNSKSWGDWIHVLFLAAKILVKYSIPKFWFWMKMYNTKYYHIFLSSIRFYDTCSKYGKNKDS